MRTNIYSAAALGSLFGTVALLTSCSDEKSPLEPEEPAGPTFSFVQQTLQADCAACHGPTSGRVFLVDMDSAALVMSGMLNPLQPGQSMLLAKPQNTIAHGGGVVAALTAQEISVIESWIALQPVLNLNSLEAQPVGSNVPPVIDGYANDYSWRTTKALLTPISGGWADAKEVALKAAYDAEYLYILARWVDDKESIVRQPWEKQADGTWKKAAAKPRPADGTDWAAYMTADFDEEAPNIMYEDKFAFIWNTYGASTVKDFDQAGCAVLCHDPAKDYKPGTTYNYTDQNLAAKKYTNSAAEIADMWHWKLVRQNHNKKIDDQWVGYWTQGGPNPANGGRFTDAGAGGYGENPAVNGRPGFRGASLTAPPFYIQDADKVALTDADLAALPTGAMIANMITSMPSGTRADVDAKGIHDPATKTWTLEIRRRLVTGDSKDVQFDDLDREYAFGVAVFDNAQIEHSWSAAVYKLKFKK